MPNRIYLDNAATSWPKPDSVYQAVRQYLETNGAPFGRGSNLESDDVTRVVRTCRTNIAKLIGSKDLNRIIFTYSGTDSLNTVFHGVLRPGDHVITTAAEHNSVLRPLRFLESTRDVTVTRVPVDSSGMVDPNDFRRAICAKTRLIALIHASNVTGTIQPAQEIGRISRDHNLLFLLDAAQSMGHVELSVETLNCDFLAAPGHKGLFGLTGTGVLYIGPRSDGLVHPFRQGGTGSNSERDDQPDELPDKFEAGNHNVPGLIGLNSGVEYVLNQSVDNIRSHEVALMSLLLRSLRQSSNVRVFGPTSMDDRVGVISLQVNDFSPHELAAVLDTAPIRIQGRAGFHCSPSIHRAIGSADEGGTFRLSLSSLVTADQIEQALTVLKSVLL